MTETTDLARCPSCQGYYDADDMTGGQCPNCAGPEPVDPWEGKVVPAGEYEAIQARGLAAASRFAHQFHAERDQARRFTAAWQGDAEAYREVVGALTHEFCPNLGAYPHNWCGEEIANAASRYCALPPDHPVHRTVAVIQAELQPEEIRDAPDFDSGQVPASPGEQQR